MPKEKCQMKPITHNTAVIKELIVWLQVNQADANDKGDQSSPPAPT